MKVLLCTLPIVAGVRAASNELSMKQAVLVLILWSFIAMSSDLLLSR